MKKFIFMLVFAFVALASSAQVGRLYTTANDTITNTGAVTSDIITLTGSYNAVVVSLKFTTLTGTSGGSAVFQGSIDGTNYTTLTDGIIKMYPSSTLTIANAAVFHFVVPDNPFKYYKIVSTGSGTSTTKVEVKYLYK